MGFVANKVYKLVFEDDLEGLEVRARSVPLGKMLGLAKLDGLDFKTLDLEDQLATLKELFTVFAQALVSWNVEVETADGTRPLPATFEGLEELDPPTAWAILSAWMTNVMGVSGPLERRSPSGGPSLEASLPMEPLSPSPPS